MLFNEEDFVSISIIGGSGKHGQAWKTGRFGRRTGSCSKPGTKACREKQRREQLNEKFMELSYVLEPTRTPKTDKSAILDDAIRVVNQLRGEALDLKETNQKLLEEIKSLKKNELREEKLVLKADKEKMEQQLKSMAVPSPGFMPSHPAAAYHPFLNLKLCFSIMRACQLE
ncbi:unnamed protein product [Thlaspi arvense]|uniref:BHLH domain-containing protein n=1 Tax=Thlaspi arvense TaxID=13288 RepID=A0AAU9RVB4_THLAR|nr:unnamed protein product [Thlaspi arvense]